MQHWQSYLLCKKCWKYKIICNMQRSYMLVFKISGGLINPLHCWTCQGLASYTLTDLCWFPYWHLPSKNSFFRQAWNIFFPKICTHLLNLYHIWSVIWIDLSILTTRSSVLFICYFIWHKNKACMMYLKFLVFYTLHPDSVTMF